MSKKNRGVVAKVKVTDAAQFIASLRAVSRPLPGDSDVNLMAADFGARMLEQWDKERVVVRVDPDFVTALATADTDSEVADVWVDYLPFGTVAVSFAEPLVMWDGQQECHYLGFLAVGMRSREVGNTGDGRTGRAWSTYGPMGANPIIRTFWTFTVPGDAGLASQTVTVPVRRDEGKAPLTIKEMVEFMIGGQEMVAAEQGGTYDRGEELTALTTLALQLLMYLSATEPDLDELAPDSFARPTPLERARVVNAGWHVGAALRAHGAGRDDVPTGERRPGHVTGWRLPPHIRRAHWHRVRVATRDADGNIIGTRTGVQGVDWEYRMRFYPPTPVNVSEQGADPVVRDLDHA